MPNAATLTAGAEVHSTRLASPTGIFAVMRREFGRIARRRTYPILAIVLPLVGWFILRSVFGAHVARDLPVVVVDNDHSLLSRRVIRAIDATSAVRVVESRGDGEDEERFLLRGDAYAVVVLTEGMQRAVTRNERIPVLLFTNAQWMLPSSLISRDVRAAVATVSGELDVRNRVARGETIDRAKVAAEPIRAELHPLYNPALDYAAFLFLALIPTLLHVFVLSLAVQAVGSELKGGSAPQWLTTSGGSLSTALIGKILPYTIWFTALGVVLLEGALYTLDLPIAREGSRLTLYAGILGLVVAYQALGLFLIAWTANFRLASSLAGFLAGPAFAVAGVSFPRFAMPVVAQWWSAALPLSHYLRLQTEQVIVGANGRSALELLGVLLLFAVAFTAVSVPRLRYVTTDAKYWGLV